MRAFVGLSAAALVWCTAHVSATVLTMDFDHDWTGAAIASGSKLVDQYSGWGVTFTPDAVYRNANTDMTITRTDVDSNYNPSLGNIWHSLNGWVHESADPSVRIDFASGITSLSMDVISDSNSPGGVHTAAFAFDAGDNPVGWIAASGVNGVEHVGTQFRGVAKYVLLFPGDFGDWVGIDNVSFNMVPEPASVLAIAALPLLRRRRKGLSGHSTSKPAAGATGLAWITY